MNRTGTSKQEVRPRRRKVDILLWAFAGLAVLAPAVLFGVGLCAIAIYLRGPRFDESKPMLVRAKVEKYCGFEFPEEVEALKAGERLHSGIEAHPSYQFVVRFTTDHNGFAELREALADARPATPDGSYRSDPRDFRRGAPKWYRAEIKSPVIYESRHAVFENLWIALHTICFESKQAGRVEVCMEGNGNSSIMTEPVAGRAPAQKVD